jgi:hypothetical protein
MRSETGRWSSGSGHLKYVPSYWHWRRAWRVFLVGEDAMGRARDWWLGWHLGWVVVEPNFGGGASTSEDESSAK